MTILFWVSLLLIAHSYILYPLILAALTSLSVSGKKNDDVIDDASLPTVTIIIPARNEEKCIAMKVKNALGQDYPREKLDVVVASDCSDDRTVEIARANGDERLSVYDFKERRGKLGVINKCMELAHGELVVLTDANAMFSPCAVRRLAEHFIDKNVGCAGGAKVIMQSGEKTAMAEGIYWKYESFVKKLESNLLSTTGLDGAIYMVRKEAFSFHRTDRIFMDDLAISLSIIEQGYRCIYNERAMASEKSSGSLSDEYRRKERIAAGSLNVVLHHLGLLLPFKSPIAFQLFSHKILRWFSFLFMIAAFISNAFLAFDGYFYFSLLALQVFFYCLALIGLAFSGGDKKLHTIFNMPFYFAFTNAAQGTGILKLMVGSYKPYWERTTR
ncbi:MAG: glycosyltransferase family 2 protein [Candidatus Schekmanbacteria bacterium]|nr:glycosyltransferase family 2 protein [Candidatus Schekmanbacteria bacterium]